MRSSPETGTIAPDGGWGWVIVAASFLLQALNGAMMIALPSVLYSDMVEAFSTSSSTMGWCLSTMYLLSSVCSILVSRLCVRFGVRPVAVAGGVLSALTLILSSLWTNLIVFFVTFSLFLGMSASCTIYANMVMPQVYFKKRRVLASGLAGCGIAIGNISYAPFADLLKDTFGWRGAMQISAAIWFHSVALGLLLRPLPEKVLPSETNDKVHTVEDIEHMTDQTPDKIPLRKNLDKTFRRNGYFILFLAGITLLSFSGNLSFSHTVSRCRYIGIESREAALVLSCQGLGSLFSRLILLLRISRTTVILCITNVAFILAAACIMLFSRTIVFMTSALTIFGFGACLGLITGLAMTVVRDLVGLERFPKAVPFYLIGNGIAAFISVPLAGWLYDTTRDYNIPFFISGFVILTGAVCVSVIIITRFTCGRK